MPVEMLYMEGFGLFAAKNRLASVSEIKVTCMDAGQTRFTVTLDCQKANGEKWRYVSDEVGTYEDAALLLFKTFTLLHNAGIVTGVSPVFTSEDTSVMLTVEDAKRLLGGKFSEENTDHVTVIHSQDIPDTEQGDVPGIKLMPEPPCISLLE